LNLGVVLNELLDPEIQTNLDFDHEETIDLGFCLQSERSITCIPGQLFWFRLIHLRIQQLNVTPPEIDT
jgi:hypothetical protein